MRRFLARLRSRRLAVWLLAGLLAYMALASFIPMGAPSSAEYLRWASAHPTAASLARLTGLNSPFRNPALIAAEAFLALATASCAWERTRGAVRNFRRWARPDETVLRHLAVSRLCATAPGDGEPQTGDSGAAVLTRALRLRSRSRGEVTVAAVRPWAVFASPAFHWALVGIFVFAALGALSRGEGGMRIVEGSGKVDEAGSYMGGYEAGPLFPGYTGTRITIPSIRDKVIVDGIDRGTSPLVRLARAGRQMERLVFPNSVAALGRLSVHRQEMGVGVVLDLDFPDGQRLAGFEHLFEAVNGDGLPGASSFEVSLPGGDTMQVTVEALVGKRVRITPEDGKPITVGFGETAQLTQGIRVTPVRSIKYAQLRVVSDWSLPWVYACFTIVCVASSIALLAPPRIVWMMENASGELRVIVLGNRSDQAFRLQVENRLADLPREKGAES